MSANENLISAKRFLKALEEFDFDALKSFYTEDAEQTELPNQLKPKGDHRTVDQLVADFTRSKGILRKQSYRVSNELASDDRVMLEFIWEGELAVSIGSLSPGDTMRSHSAVCMDFKDGLIHRQRNYDCFEAF
ncbi:nuclear transport factor 2 family protein [Pseudovibrio brasiliensis]|uniref:Nuclear transport factor 2 family protein n=1 Tax=Pseudovibrio brasiliensis TaxID=1898042 RepID=A0ABX8AR63_9HYPH|nr:nuclear transport factor 2 family protein [Pseudovibrio brasiliensis]QUS57558.1 nuclear transport factor 2 family protein [Pseudovibrio brasiliensis]